MYSIDKVVARWRDRDGNEKEMVFGPGVSEVEIVLNEGSEPVYARSSRGLPLFSWYTNPPERRFTFTNSAIEIKSGPTIQESIGRMTNAELAEIIRLAAEEQCKRIKESECKLAEVNPCGETFAKEYESKWLKSGPILGANPCREVNLPNQKRKPVDLGGVKLDLEF